MRTRNEIIEFIKNSCFYKPLCYNLFIQKGISFEHALELYNCKRSVFSGGTFVSFCFHWATTIEGYEYWSEVCNFLDNYERSSD